mmetsp:Transcript_76304/g.218257  ORF Transcript_76304/g.218257 Transcript_76304/m.218257 type:complete len:861 (+) Transcript_76304:563-3145(+)
MATPSTLGTFHFPGDEVHVKKDDEKLQDDFEGHARAEAHKEEHAYEAGIGFTNRIKVPSLGNMGGSTSNLGTVSSKNKVSRKVSDVSPLMGTEANYDPSAAPEGGGMSPRSKMDAYRNHKGSLQRSMSQYSMRRLIMQEGVESGAIANTLSAEEAVKVHITMQGNTEMYSNDNQLKRSELKRSEKMRELAMHVWRSAANGHTTMDKEEFEVMITKFHILMVPPGGNNQDLHELAEYEWEHDSQGKDYMSFEDFFTSLWQLVDTWTETVQEEEYVSFGLSPSVCLSDQNPNANPNSNLRYLHMLKRIILGTMYLENQIVLKWKENKDIVYDKFFAFIEHELENQKLQQADAHAHGLDDDEIENELNAGVDGAEVEVSEGLKLVYSGKRGQSDKELMNAIFSDENLAAVSEIEGPDYIPGEDTGHKIGYEWCSDGPQGVGYYKDYIKRDTDEGPMAGYQFIPDGPLGTGYYRVKDDPPYYIAASKKNGEKEGYIYKLYGHLGAGYYLDHKYLAATAGAGGGNGRRMLDADDAERGEMEKTKQPAEQTLGKSAMRKYSTTKKPREFTSKTSSLGGGPTRLPQHKPVILSLRKTIDLINKLYKAKLIADTYRARPETTLLEKHQIVRFDKFIIKYFLLFFGTRGVARRNLRSFSASVEYHRQHNSHPRIHTFHVLSGMGSSVYDARLMPHHMVPLLRYFFPDLRRLDDDLGNGQQVCLVKLKDFKRLSTPHYLNDVALAAGIVAKYEYSLDEMAVKKPGGNPKIRWIDLDEALVMVLPLWMMCEKLHVFRRHWAMRKMLAYSKKFLERRREMRKQGIIVEKRASTKVKKGRVFNRTATMDRSPDLTKSPGKSPGVLDRVYGGGV